ncbi:glycosyltransferase family 39 protein [Fulvivirga sp. M361]|uniref:ArnT family glycosyltransferase n=1 Tax=Fulvivirga sp. M361 TaxID=2594266 RepID=UPI001179B7C2|nr:phospholipid carrier-dependent glycosyltransferase [Fulvivirga sp. M361]TRX58379.1 glycosyltransferase family 39 protein [Fulvivirga sp. M361]
MILKTREWIYLTLICVVFTVVYYNTYDEKIAILGDNATYYILGKGLSEFKGFVNYASPTQTPHNHFPPGYPFLLSIVMLIVSDDMQVMKILNGLLTLGIGLLSYFMIKRLTGKDILAAFIAVAIVMNANLLYYSSVMMSEVPFAFFTLLALSILTRMSLEKPFFRDPYFFIVVGLIVFSFYMRAFGVALLGGVVVYFLTRKKWWHSIAAVGGFILGVIPWQIRSYQMGGSNQLNVMFRKNYYRPESGNIDAVDLWERIIINFQRIFSIELPEAIMPIINLSDETTNTVTKWLIGLIFLAIVIYGIKKMSSTGILVGGYLGFTILILFIWPDYFSSSRYLVPVIPILLISFYAGLYQLLNQLTKSYTKRVQFNPLFLLVFIFFFISPLKELSKASRQNYSPQWAEFFALAEWSKTNIAEGAVVCSRKPNLFYLFSKHPSCNYRYTEDPDDLLDGLNRHKVDYVVFDQLGFSTTPRCLGKAINTYQDRFKVIQYIGPEKRRTYFFDYNR